MDIPIYQFIGKRIRTFRKAYPLSQAALAQLLDVTPNTVSRWETAEYKISIQDLQKLASCFGMPISAFLPDSPTEPKVVITITEKGKTIARYFATAEA